MELDGCKSKHMFVALGASVNGLILGYRKMLFVDGTYLSGPYEGTMLAAVALDADNHIYLMLRMQLLEERPMKIGCGS